MRKTVYVMAPFRSTTEMGRQANIWRAKLAGVELARAGFAPLVPHVAVAYYYDEMPEEDMMEVCLSLLGSCDVALRISTSEGVLAECLFADIHKITVYNSLEELCAGQKI